MKVSLKTMKKYSIIPGFQTSITITLLYVLGIVVLPLFGLVFVTTQIGFAEFLHIIVEPRLLHAYKISFGCALIASCINVVFGTILTWVLVRHNFFGKKIIDAMIDIPLVLPTAVAGIALTVLYSPNGWIGKHLSLKIAFGPLGIIIALVFIGLPFVVRTLQVVLEDFDKEVEEAAESLGANRLQVFVRIIIPHVTTALLTGFSMALVRSLGEYGSVVFISGNMPFVSEVVPLMIMMKLEQYDYSAATAIAIVMLTTSFAILLLINYFQKLNYDKTK